MEHSDQVQLAKHEVRLNQIEGLLPELSATLKSIDKKLDENFVTRREYDKHYKDQIKHNDSVEDELAHIKKNMMTKKEFQEFKRSQFWQKFMTFLGGIGSAVIVALLIAQLTVWYETNYWTTQHITRLERCVS